MPRIGGGNIYNYRISNISISTKQFSTAWWGRFVKRKKNFLPLMRVLLKVANQSTSALFLTDRLRIRGQFQRFAFLTFELRKQPIRSLFVLSIIQSIRFLLRILPDCFPCWATTSLGLVMIGLIVFVLLVVFVLSLMFIRRPFNGENQIQPSLVNALFMEGGDNVAHIKLQNVSFSLDRMPPNYWGECLNFSNVKSVDESNLNCAQQIKKS